MQKYIMTYTRTFTTEFVCESIAAAESRSKHWIKSFPPGEITIVSIYKEGYVAPAEPELTKMEKMVDGMRKRINSMLTKESA
jgi:hypothetical protein